MLIVKYLIINILYKSTNNYQKMIVIITYFTDL